MSRKKRRRLRAKVQKVIKPISPRDTERAEIRVDEADELYREIRVENVLTDEAGEKAHLKPGAEIDVILEADTDTTTKRGE